MVELRYFEDRIAEFSKEIGDTSYKGFIEETRQRLHEMGQRKQLWVDLFHHSNSAFTTRNAAAEIKQQAADASTVVLNMVDEKTPQAKVFQRLEAAFLILLADEALAADEKAMAKIRTADKYRLALVVDCFQPNTNGINRVAASLGSRIRHTVVPLQDIAGKSFSEILGTIIEPKLWDKATAYEMLTSLKPMFSFFREIVDSENRAANTRKLLSTQNAGIIRKDEQSMNHSDLMQNIRQALQKHAQELDKAFKQKYDDLQKPNTGKFAVFTVERASLLTDFERTNLAEKSEKVQTTIAESFIKDLLDSTKTLVRSELAKDEAFIRSSIDDLIKKTNLQLKAKGISVLNTPDVMVPFPDKERTVSAFCHFNRMYTGEIIKKGAMEYFVALRDYTGLIMVVGGLLAPLSIVASASDSGIFKYIANWVKGTTAAISLLMIIYGIYDLRKRIPLKREEEFQRELTKARELLQNETRRMLTEAGRDWSANLAAWIRDVSQNIGLQVEKNMKELQTNRVAMMNQEKQQLQKQQTVVDNMLRNIQSAERIREGLSNRHRDMMTELEKELKL